MQVSTAPSRDAWTAFGLGVLGGVIGGLSMLSFAGIFALAIGAIGLGVLVRPRPFGAAGASIGVGTVWLILLAGAEARCDPRSCVGPDLTPWAAIGVVLVVVGVVLLALGIRAVRRAVP
jgi:hypothetical protein